MTARFRYNSTFKVKPRTPLKRATSPLQRRKPLKRSQLHRKRRKYATLEEQRKARKERVKTRGILSGVRLPDGKKIWSCKTADNYFSLFIRERDGKCLRCFTTSRPLDCSHYYGRANSITRFDPQNCIALCRECHDEWESKKRHEYREFMIQLLGIEGYLELEGRARQFKKRFDAIKEFQISHPALLASLQEHD